MAPTELLRMAVQPLVDFREPQHGSNSFPLQFFQHGSNGFFKREHLVPLPVRRFDAYLASAL